VVIAYPLRRTGWIYCKRRFEDAGVGAVFVGLRASYASITAADRGRDFTPAEHDRIQALLEQGYAERPFSDLTVDTDKAPFEATVRLLMADLRKRLSVAQV
jgi:hypothetical protein